MTGHRGCARADRRRGAARGHRLAGGVLDQGPDRRVAVCSSPGRPRRRGDPARPPLDRAGLALSTLGVLALVYTIIEAPEQGWLAARTLAGFARRGRAARGFVAWERRTTAPLLDVRLFRNPRFSAASRRGHALVLRALRVHLPDHPVLPVPPRLRPARDRRAAASGRALDRVAAVLGHGARGPRRQQARRLQRGCCSPPVMFVWTSNVDGSTTATSRSPPQMVMLGTAMGLTSAPATESIMGAIPRRTPASARRSTTRRASSAARSASR